MKNLYYLFIVLLTMSTSAQVGIGVSAANISTSAQLEVNSTTKGFLTPRMTMVQRNAIVNSTTGLLVYQTDSVAGFYYFDGTVWKQNLGLSSYGTANQVLTTDGAGATTWANAPAATPGVDLTTNQTVGGLKTFSSEDGLMATGTIDLGNSASLGPGTRMMWYPKKAAFRAGQIDGTQWNDSSIGKYSSAMGYNAIASGSYSTAFGRSVSATGNHSIAMGYNASSVSESVSLGNNTNASGNNSVAFGKNTTSSGNYSTAMGFATIASGLHTSALGIYTTARSFSETVIGTYNTDYTPASTAFFNATDRLFVIGNGLNGAKSDALVMLKNGNTTFSGQIKTGTVTYPNTNGTANQILTTDGAGNATWANAPAATPGVDLTTNQTVNGLKTFSSEDGLIATGTFGSGTTSSLGAGTRMMWYPKKAAFRAGQVDGTQWNDANIGDYSFAAGQNNQASGSNSSVLGVNSTASGVFSSAIGILNNSSGLASQTLGYSNQANSSFSTAIGTLSRALASYSTAIGNSTTASGEASTTLGNNTFARSYAETTIGTYNTDYTPTSTSIFSATDRLFVIGNGIYGALSDALVMLKNGNTTFSGTITAASVTQSSDLRLKRTITPLQNSLAAVMQLNPVSYEKKNSLASTEYSSKENGFIAQEIKSVFPTLVLEGTDKDKLLSVNYTALIPVLTKAIQEQQKEIEALKALVEKLINQQK